MLSPEQNTAAPPPAQSSGLNFLPAAVTGAGDAVKSLPASTPAPQDAQAAPAEGTAPAGQESPDAQTIQKNLAAHLDQLSDGDKQFLAEHLTPEFVRAIGLINGPEVAQYLNQFADPNKVMVPVPRQVAEQFLAQQKQGQAPQGQPQQAAPSQAPMAPPQAGPQPGMMNPQQATATPPTPGGPAL